MRKKRIKIGEITGKYDDGIVKLEIGRTGADTKVYINGKILKDVLAIEIRIQPRDVTKVYIERTPFI